MQKQTSCTITIQTDKTEVKPGDTVTITGQILIEKIKIEILKIDIHVTIQITDTQTGKTIHTVKQTYTVTPTTHTTIVVLEPTHIQIPDLGKQPRNLKITATATCTQAQIPIARCTTTIDIAYIPEKTPTRLTLEITPK